MIKHLITLCIMFMVIPGITLAQNQKQTFTAQGRVTEAKSKEVIPGAVISLPDYGLWGVADGKGSFSIARIPGGKTRFVVTCLGYASFEVDIDISKNTEGLNFQMKEDNLSLETVTVTAKENKGLNTSRVIERQALEHMQIISATDISSLLPGGTTKKLDLFDTDPRAFRFNLRGGDGNGSFGTAVEVDGVRLSSNSDMSAGFYGPATRNVGVADIESVEIITGVPSVEYGDMTSGMVIIKSKRGRTPLSVSISANPSAKTYSISKGFGLGENLGILNTSVEYTHAFKDAYSRYTTYNRNAYSLSYSNNFKVAGKMLDLRLNGGGSYGLQRKKSDPDRPSTDWNKSHDSAMRFGVNANWLINSKWITSLTAEANANYTDSFSEDYSYVTSATSKPVMNAEESGYYETDRQPTKYFRDKIVDSKGLSMSARLQYRLNQNFGGVNNNIKAGVSWSSTGNVGRGEWYRNDIVEDGYRPYPYTDIPFINNYSAYLEDNIRLPMPGKTSLDIMAGVRYEQVDIKNMVYKDAYSFSPRFNARYTIVGEKRGKKGFLRELSIRGGWGMMEKLPSLGLLYPKPGYRDILVYDKNYGTQNSYYSVGLTDVYTDYLNPELKWSRSRNAEIGLNVNLGGVQISAAYFNNKSKNPYISESIYTKYGYRKSDGQFAVPNNPSFRVDKATGMIYVSDLDIPGSPEVLIPALVNDTIFIKNSKPSNDVPYTTHGAELVVDFGQIKAIRTSFRVDANYAYSKRVNEKLTPSYQASTSYSGLPQGRSYDYVFFYPGGTNPYNGSKSEEINANFTATTHIPEIRMTISLRIESAVMWRRQYLTQYQGNEWAFMVDENGNRLPSVYGQRGFAYQYPVAYMGLDGIIRPFTEAEAADPKFWDAKVSTNTDSSFIKDGYNFHIPTVNISITKEIGDIFSLSFYANNFINSNPMVREWASERLIAKGKPFSYGATLRIKIQ